MESFYAKLRHFVAPEDVEEPESDQSENNSEDTRKIPVENPGRFECPYCFNVYHTNEDLISHKRTHHLSKQYTCKWCNIIFTYTGWCYHYKKHTNDKRYSCASCNKKFFLLQQLQSHVAHHKHSCSFCTDTFVTAKQLRAHRKSVHNIGNDDGIKLVIKRRGRRWDSNRASKQITTQAEILRNETKQRKVPEIHQTERRIEDGKSFVRDYETIPQNSPSSQVGTKKKHRIRTSKSFVCDKCDMKFPKLHLLRNHLKKQFKCRPYWCNDCNAKFIQKKMIEKHVRNHLYKCDSCSRNFSYKHYLDVHRYNEHMLSINNHSFATETGFRCQYCGLKYTTEEDLQNHIKFSGENLIICSRCFNVSETEYDFDYHLKTVHDIRP